MQTDRDFEIAKLLERAVRKMQFSTFDGKTGLRHGLGNIGGADRTKQLAFIASLGPLKQLGDFEIPVSLHAEVNFKITVSVVVEK